MIQVHCALPVTYNSDGYEPVQTQSLNSNFELAACKTLASKNRSHHASGYVLEGLGSSSRPPSARGLSSPACGDDLFLELELALALALAAEQHSRA